MIDFCNIIIINKNIRNIYKIIINNNIFLAFSYYKNKFVIQQKLCYN